MTAFRRELIWHRLARYQQREQLLSGLFFHSDGVCLSVDGWLYVVWTMTPRCKWCRVLSVWDDLEQATASASRAIRTRRRRLLVVAGFFKSTKRRNLNVNARRTGS